MEELIMLLILRMTIFKISEIILEVIVKQFKNSTIKFLIILIIKIKYFNEHLLTENIEKFDHL